MFKKEVVKPAEVVLKNEIVLVDASSKSVKSDSFIMANPNWVQRQAHRIVGGLVFAGCFLILTTAGSSIAVVVTPERLVISGKAVLGLFGLWLGGRLMEELGVTAYILKKLGVVQSKRN